MACLREERSSEMLSSTCVVLEEEEEKMKREEKTTSVMMFSASKYKEYRLEKVFPVYAMGNLKLDDNLLTEVTNLDSDMTANDIIWDAVRTEAKTEAEKEPILSSFLYASVLSHDCLERALGFVLANRLQDPILLATQLMDIFYDVMMHDRGIQRSIRLDVQAFKDRDPSCMSYCWVLLYLKGYHSLQSYRVAHALWNKGRKVLALALQSRISEVNFGLILCLVLIWSHSAARIGHGILLDHATGVVIGETAVVGNKGVTLGGTGNEIGDRHPKIGQGALIGASATILGNIKIGEGAMVAAGSLVLKDIPPHSMVAGIPAQVVGYVKEQDPSLTMKHDATKDFFQHVAAANSVEGRSNGNLK
ncbi:Bacterial transferase hexapeptide repeat [Macleaya cordata]|uniref:serine O-acetyltransferase n=1 Tax=Macleaya cordata TaxID=56857 RepID=A0A200PQW7_MACCD|nr:Bacterial transferase hexapeptide repeat [Macleaya cordata]